MQLTKMADVDTHAAILLPLPGRLQLIANANKGSNTVAKAKYIVNESWYGEYVCKLLF
jgi:hypothetical protein